MSEPSPTPSAPSAPGLGLFGTGAVAGDVPVCSRKGCRAAAQWQLLWNNPRIHTPDRRKAWASCPVHVGWFEEYLGERGLWKQTLPLTADRPMETR